MTTTAVKDAAHEALNDLSEDLASFLANPSLKAALADGSLDLTSYSNTVEEELEELEATCIQKYKENTDEILGLEKEVSESLRVLHHLQEMLLGFKADLGGLSGELKQLQEKSKTIDVQLKNRRQAEAGLRAFLEHIVVAPSVVQAIQHQPVNLTFLRAVQEVHQIYKDAHTLSPQEWACDKVPSETLAGQEMKHTLTQLRSLAVVRIREYFLKELAKFNAQTNIRMMQVHGLLKYAALQDFLEEAAPQVAVEILNVYIDTLGNLLAQLFRTYFHQLQQLDITKEATRQDVIAIEDALLRDSLTTKARKRTEILALGTRLQDCYLQQAPIIAHVAQAQKKQYHFERLYRSILQHLVDVVTNEHVFCRQFFKRDLFQPLFASTLQVILEQFENYLFSCNDAIGILLMIKLTHHFKRLARERKIHSLDSFLDQCTRLLWPRLRTVLDAHNRSLVTATAVKLGVSEQPSLHSHYVTRRFTEFCCSLLLILHDSSMSNQSPKRTERKMAPQKLDDGDSEHSKPTHVRQKSMGEDSAALAQSAGDKLLEDLDELCQNYILLLERLADEHKTQKSKIVFMVNNIDHVVTLFQDRRVVGKEFNLFLEKLMKQRELFVEEELLAGFSKMIAFVQQTEAHIASNPKGPFDVNTQVVESLVLEFASNWKSSIEQINRDVLSYFSNFRNGMEILKQVLTQLLLYYTRFQDIIRKVWKGKPPAFAKDIVSTTIILAEIKKYALSV